MLSSLELPSTTTRLSRTNTTDIQTNGSPQSRRPLVTDTPNAHSSRSSLLSLRVCAMSDCPSALANAGAGPRFALVALWYFLTARPNSSLPKFVAFAGIFRTLTCGGWTYVTSTDNHDWHDVFMISYLVATIPWTAGCLALSPPNAKAIKYRKYLAGAFFGTLVPLIYFYIQHKVHRVPGGKLDVGLSLAKILTESPAYTIYAFFEWSLVLFDVAFDAVTALDFETFEIVIKDVRGMSKGYVYWLPK